MGNRGWIVFENNDSLALYLHWNGGRDSIEPFLAYAKLCGVNDLSGLATVINNALGVGGCEIQLFPEGTVKAFKGSEYIADNGLYVIDENLNIVERVTQTSEQDVYDFNEFMVFIQKTSGAYMEVPDEVLAHAKTASIVRGGKFNSERHHVVQHFDESEGVNVTHTFKPGEVAKVEKYILDLRERKVPSYKVWEY